MFKGILSTALLICSTLTAHAQSLEPRFYSNAPKGLNFLLGGYAHSSGGLSLDPALPIENAELEVHTLITAYARTLGLFGNSAKFDITVPYTFLDGTATLSGDPIERKTDGMNDPVFRFSYNFYGAPALTLPEFMEYEQDLVMGASVKMSAPFGAYDSDKAVNIGQNRWTISPELGISKRLGRLMLEAAGLVTFYTDNDDFLGQTKEQEPLYALQAHIVYQFKNTMWIALDATRYAGGRSTLGGVEKEDRIDSARFGTTLTIPVSKRNSIKLFASTGVATRTGTDFDSAGAVWQYRWGGGL